MSKYLGEFPVDVASHPEYKNYTPADWAMYFIAAYGQIDGDHHKTWVLDQAARCLKGVPIIVVEARWDNGHTEDRIRTSPKSSDEYRKWVKSMRKGGYSYDKGIAP